MIATVKKIFKRILGEEHFQIARDFAAYFSNSKKRNITKKKNFYSGFVKKDDLCFDVGANFGNRITPLLEIGAKIIAVEPQEACYKYLERKFGEKIVIEKKGLCENEGFRDFYVSKSRTLSSFSKEWINSVKQDRFKDYIWEKPIRVEMTTLDNLIKKYGVPHYIKIDVEGYELEVLKGLTTPVKMISFEYTVPEQLDKIAQCIKVVQGIDTKIVCNYSIGESMEWANREWLAVSEFIELIKAQSFINTCSGDVYLMHSEC